ncbi:hypothetical protein D3C83_229390 [compost metagenome]
MRLGVRTGLLHEMPEDRRGATAEISGCEGESSTAYLGVNDSLETRRLWIPWILKDRMPPAFRSQA